MAKLSLTRWLRQPTFVLAPADCGISSPNTIVWFLGAVEACQTAIVGTGGHAKRKVVSAYRQGLGGGRTCDRCDGPCGRRCRNTVEEQEELFEVLDPAVCVSTGRIHNGCCQARAHAGRGHSRTEVETDTSEDETSASVKAGGAPADVRPQGWVLARTCSTQGNLNQLCRLTVSRHRPNVRVQLVCNSFYVARSRSPRSVIFTMRVAIHGAATTQRPTDLHHETLEMTNFSVMENTTTMPRTSTTSTNVETKVAARTTAPR